MWRNALVSPEDTVRKTLVVINQYALRAAFVVDKEGCFLGLVTDGDIRRGLLKEIGLDMPVCKVMNSKPFTCKQSETRADQVFKVLEQRKFLHLPIVDDLGRLVDVMTFDRFGSSHRKDNPIFIMAGGFGTRLRPLTDNCPKPMLQVGGKPILERIIERFIAHGFHRFYLSTHYLPEIIQDYFGDGSKWGVYIEYVHEETPLGTGGALGLLPETVGELPLIMMNGDILTKINFSNLLDYHNERNCAATMCVREYEHQVPFGVISIDGLTITQMIEKPVHRFFVNAGIYVLNQDMVKNVRMGQKIDTPTLLQAEMARGGSVCSFPIHEYWLDIGRMDDFQKAQQDVAVVFD